MILNYYVEISKFEIYRITSIYLTIKLLSYHFIMCIWLNNFEIFYDLFNGETIKGVPWIKMVCVDKYEYVVE